MHSLPFENIRKVIAHKKLLEKKLKVKILIKKKFITISGTEENEYFAVKVFEAIDADFPIDISLLIADSPEEYMIEHLSIKEFTRRPNLAEVRARIIGRKGKTKQIIEDLSNCYISLHENTVSIIGNTEDIGRATQAITKLIQGSKQSSVYGFLEKSGRRFYSNLGLKK
ncbi:MAG: KH domain-containing protein [archaeon]